MKLCLISFEYPPDSVTMGGAGTYARFLVKELENRGVDVCTITSGTKFTCFQNVYRLPIPNKTYWRRLFFIKQAVYLMRDLNKIHHFDLVHFNEPHIIPVITDIPTVSTFHSTQLHELELNLKGHSLKTVKNIMDLVVKNPVGHLCDIITGQISNRIICPSSDMVKLLKFCLVDEQKIHVINNGINPNLFDGIECDNSFLEEHGIKEGSYILYIGRLYSLKGIHYLIEAFKTIKKEHPEIKLVIVGSGDFESYLREISKDIRGILFMGFIDSPMIKKLLYENCFTVVVPSIYETFPMVVLEAMTCGKAVIASNVGGIRSMIRHGKNGFLVRPKDVMMLATYIKKLYEEPNLRRKMGMVSRYLIETEFSIVKMVDETLKVYESLS